MLKKIWQSFVRWFRNLFGRGTSGSTLAPRGYAKNRIVAHADLPPLDDTDREYLFMQLLEGVAHGWQQPRAIGFFNKIRQRVRKSDWLDWLERFGNNLLEAPVANYELAGRMVQLGQLDCGEIGDLAGEYGARLLDRQAEQFAGDLLPIMEFDALEFDRLDDQIPFALGDDGSDSSQYRQFGEVPPELLIDNAPIPSPPVGDRSEAPTTASETREITLEEFSAMLHQDPGLVAELAEQFGVETTDPQAIVNIVVAQMQQQVQQVSGDLTPPTVEPEIPTAPPMVPTPGTPPEIPVEPPMVPTPGTPPEIPAEPPMVPTPGTPPEIPTEPPAVPTPGTPPEIPAPPAVPTPTTPPEVPSVPSTPPELPPSPPEVPSIPSAPPELPPLPPEVPSIPSAPPEISPATPTMPGISAKQHGTTPPPPPPFPKLEYKPEDPWQNNTSGDREQTLPEAANTPDRRGV